MRVEIESGKSRVENREWNIESGNRKLKIESGKLRVESGESNVNIEELKV